MVLVNDIEVKYVFEENADTTLDDILIYILNSKIRVVDFESET